MPSRLVLVLVTALYFVCQNDTSTTHLSFHRDCYLYNGLTTPSSTVPTTPTLSTKSADENVSNTTTEIIFGRKRRDNEPHGRPKRLMDIWDLQSAVLEMGDEYTLDLMYANETLSNSIECTMKFSTPAAYVTSTEDTQATYYFTGLHFTIDPQWNFYSYACTLSISVYVDSREQFFFGCSSSIVALGRSGMQSEHYYTGYGEKLSVRMSYNHTGRRVALKPSDLIAQINITAYAGQYNQEKTTEEPTKTQSSKNSKQSIGIFIGFIALFILIAAIGVCCNKIEEIKRAMKNPASAITGGGGGGGAATGLLGMAAGGLLGAHLAKNDDPRPQQPAYGSPPPGAYGAMPAGYGAPHPGPQGYGPPGGTPLGAPVGQGPPDFAGPPGGVHPGVSPGQSPLGFSPTGGVSPGALPGFGIEPTGTSGYGISPHNQHPGLGIPGQPNQGYGPGLSLQTGGMDSPPRSRLDYNAAQGAYSGASHFPLGQTQAEKDRFL